MPQLGLIAVLQAQLVRTKFYRNPLIPADKWVLVRPVDINYFHLDRSNFYDILLGESNNTFRRSDRRRGDILVALDRYWSR